MRSKSLRDLYAELDDTEDGRTGAPESASPPEPSVDGPVGPPAPQESEAGAQAPPLRGRPLHPYWLGKPITESALRAVHLWPRTKPAPRAVAEAAAAWQQALRASRQAHEAAGVRDAVQVIVDAMARAYQLLGAGGAPPIEMLRHADYPDLAPTDPERIRFDGAVLLIVKCQLALHKGHERGGAWRAAVATVSTPSWES